MRIRILMITYNRVEYTRLSLTQLCATAPKDALITVWDNNSGPEMKKLLATFEGHPRIDRIIHNPTNDRLRGPTSWFWQNTTDAEYLSKVDDDGLMPTGWCETLLQAHEEIPDAGVLGCWRFLDEDFDGALAGRKIQTFGRHKLMRNCWVEGSGYLMKRAVVDKIGVLKKDESFTTWCVRAAAAGFINGWYYPFLYQEHMDDPRVPHSEMKTDADFHRLAPLSARTFGVNTREDWIRRLRHSAWTLQACSYDPGDYLGLKAKVRRKISQWTGKDLLPRA